MKIATLFCAVVLSGSAALLPPAPVYVVHPEDLPRDYQNVTVRVAMTIDAAGVPHDIAAVQSLPKSLTSQLFPALAAWRFSPGRLDGVPQSARVIIPLRLVPGRLKPTLLPAPYALPARDDSADQPSVGR